MEQKHTLSVLVENHSGVLSRVAGLFSRRGFNIDSLAVGETLNPGISRITIVVNRDDYIVDQVSKQLNKLIDVIKIKVFKPTEFVGRELVLIKINAPAETRAEVMQLVNIFRANIVDVSTKTLTVEISADQEKIIALTALLDQFGILEVVRTGMIAIERGSVKDHVL
ncbi:MAG: acetolactate synthase small subunit [Clostridiales bacterium]|nr:acetolactate synthase small subunit [Clostridiales bacterium]